jgi:hypothetical protein
MFSRSVLGRFPVWLRVTGCALLCLSGLSITTSAQSIDIAAPSPVITNAVSGTITPRDLGDARLTDHFYAFVGTPGDLLITVQSINLNGDVDVFTSTGLRPLLKFNLYAESASPVTKSLYLRKREDLIIRVEARTPNDDNGIYRLRFGGAFEPLRAPLVAEPEATPLEPLSSPTPMKGRRVSSVGARIEEPPEPEVAAFPTPEPTPAEAQPSETPSAPAVEEAAPTISKAPPRRTGPRRVPGRRTRQRPPATTETPATTEPETPAPAETEATATEPKPSAPTSRRGGRGRRGADPPAEQEPEAEVGPRLVIETDDGTLIDRSMSTVRRVTVENGLVLIVGKDGKIQRIALARVVRMSIAP